MEFYVDFLYPLPSLIIISSTTIRKMCLTHFSLTPVLLKEALKYLIFWEEKCEEMKIEIHYCLHTLCIPNYFMCLGFSSQSLMSNSHLAVFSAVGLYPITLGSVPSLGGWCLVHLSLLTSSVIRSLPPRTSAPTPSRHLSLPGGDVGKNKMKQTNIMYLDKQRLLKFFWVFIKLPRWHQW